MKYSEKMELLLKGVKLSEIKELEDQEAKETEEAAKAAEASKAAEEAIAAEVEKTALEAAQEMVKDLETKLSAKEDELTKLNAEFAKLNNKQTVVDNPPVKQTGADVLKELFHPVKKKEA